MTNISSAGLYQRSRRRDFSVTKAPLSYFEYWPGWIFYLPVVLQWIALGLKHRDLALPTLANPFIETGGMCGESKVGILDQIGAPACHLVARYTSFVTAAICDRDHVTAEAAMCAAGLSYPIVVKPDISCNGTGVRVAKGQEALRRYFLEYPRSTRVILQELIHDPLEAGVFYVRQPGEASGIITSLTLKFAPYVDGDGVSTLRELIINDQRAGQIAKLYLPRLEERLDTIPSLGERIPLVFVGNHCKGSIFQNGNSEITPAMTRCFDEMAKSLPEFYFGRFDVRYSSLADLKRGTGFRLIEVNGVGSEATHIWDKDTRLSDAYATLFKHYRMAFKIGAANRKRGYRGMKLLMLNSQWRRQKRLMASYPLSD